jgi:hypothetical protein
VYCEDKFFFWKTRTEIIYKQAEISLQKSEKAYNIFKVILRRSCSIILVLKLLCQFNIKLPSMSWGKILSRTVRSKYSMLVWQEDCAPWVGSGNHTLLLISMGQIRLKFRIYESLWILTNLKILTPHGKVI